MRRGWRCACAGAYRAARRAVLVLKVEHVNQARSFGQVAIKVCDCVNLVVHALEHFELAAKLQVELPEPLC